MICYVCDKDNWAEGTDVVDGKEIPLHSKSKILICKDCGNVVHRIEVQKEEELREFYRTQYRPAPNIVNLITTTHKQNYLMAFLREFLKGKKGLICGDVGCATGYFPAHLRNLGHRATGSEYTLTYRRFAEHYYGVPVTEELEPKHKYDFISLYHVLEHMVEPDKKLTKYVGMLASGGHMLVSTPEWLDTLEEASGTAIEHQGRPCPVCGPAAVCAFEHLFHTNHINVFTKTSLQNLFRKAGLVIVKEDRETYGQTYLLRAALPDEKFDQTLVVESWEEIQEKMRVARRAIKTLLDGDFKGALEVYAKFPEAWLKLIFLKSGKDPDKQADLFAEAEKALPSNNRLLRAKATWFYQKGEFDLAIALFDKLMRTKPNEDDLMQMGYAFAQTGKKQDALACFLAAAGMDPRKWQEAQNWACKMASDMLAWDERAKGEVAKMFIEQNKDKIQINPKDPVMDGPETKAEPEIAAAP